MPDPPQTTHGEGTTRPVCQNKSIRARLGYLNCTSQPLPSLKQLNDIPYQPAEIQAAVALEQVETQQELSKSLLRITYLLQQSVFELLTISPGARILKLIPIRPA